MPSGISTATHDLGEDTIVALIYEEFCLREEDREHPVAAEFLAVFPQVASRAGPRTRDPRARRARGRSRRRTRSVPRATGRPRGRSPFPEAGETIAGFVLVEELGRGAFARVFLAKERELADRPVALKVSRRGSREPQTLARLQHTHIVPVHSHRDRPGERAAICCACLTSAGSRWLACWPTREVQTAGSGAVLAEALDRLGHGGELPVGNSSRQAGTCTPVLRRARSPGGVPGSPRPLRHAHDRGVLHRDIKPSNVLVTSDGMPMLLDFNLAREPLAEDGKSADTATLGGTIDYMAPEHLKALGEPSSQEVDGRADIYGLGVVLYEAVTGQRPFSSPRRGSSVVEALMRAIDDRTRPLAASTRSSSRDPTRLWKR